MGLYGRSKQQEPLRHTPHVRKGDTVVVLSGKDAGKQGRVHRGDAGRADDRRDDHVARRHRRDGTRAFDSGDDFESGKETAQMRRIGFAPDGDELGTIALDLLGQQLDVAARRKADDAKFFR